MSRDVSRTLLVAIFLLAMVSACGDSSEPQSVETNAVQQTANPFALFYFVNIAVAAAIIGTTWAWAVWLATVAGVVLQDEDAHEVEGHQGDDHRT